MKIQDTPKERMMGFQHSILYGHGTHENDNYFLKKEENAAYKEYEKGAKDAKLVLKMCAMYNFDIEKSEWF